MYYNTTYEKGTPLVSFEQKAESQTLIVQELFKAHRRLSASRCYVMYCTRTKGNTPITSIRRAITNLANEGTLQKTNKKQKGIYGRMEHVYEIVAHPGKQLKLL